MSIFDAFGRPKSKVSFLPLPYTVPDIGRRAQLPDWFFSTPYGQPRNADISKIRELAESVWINLCVSTTTDEFSSLDWKILPKDKNKINKQHIDEFTEFLMHPNQNGDTIQHIMKQWSRDLLEVDAGAIVKVFSNDSYLAKEKKIIIQKNLWDKENWNLKGVEDERKTIKELKPIKQRKLIEIYCRDGSSFLPDGDFTGFIHRWYQYSWKIPKKTPLIFDKDEIIYSMLHPSSHGFFGWSPIQSIEQIILTLKSQVQHSLGFFRERGVPDGIISLPGFTEEDMKALRDYWKQELTGTTNRIVMVSLDKNQEPKYIPLQVTGKDMELLAQQQWFARLCLAMYKVNIPMITLKGEAPKAGTESLLKSESKKAIRPLVQEFERVINNYIIPEFGFNDIEFRFDDYDLDIDIKKRTMDLQEVVAGVKTINEVRVEMGLKEVEWGNMPLNMQISQSIQEKQGEPKDEEIPEREGKPKEKVEEKIKKKIGEGCECDAKEIRDMSIKKFIGIDFSLVSTAMLNYIKDYDFPLVSGLTKKEKELLKELFIRALTENWTMFELERKINEIVKDDVKTDMILRTETIRIANEGALRVYDSEGIKKVKWIATPSFPGGRTCEICLNNNGKIYDLEEAKGMIPAHVNCRCAWSAVI